MRSKLTKKNGDNKKRRVSILDTTLRDGSYVINFKFSSSDTENILSGLFESGLDWIEVGHGSGLAASVKGYGKAIESDEVYLETCSQHKEARWGMFCIPGIGELKDLKLAAKYKMKFIRIGVNPNDIELSFPFIELAKNKGMTVFVNFMKSYTSSPKEFAEYVSIAKNKGADFAYIVDSAGGMMPYELKEYITACRDHSDIKLGFHGHNNLGLSISNSITAVENGVDIIDTSLQGMGRSAGNTPTEMFCFVLDRLGYEHNLDIFKLLNIGEKLVRPFLKNKYGTSSLDTVAGYAKFHSSYMNQILKFAKKYSIDPRKIIIEVSLIDRLNPDNATLEKACEKLIREKEDLTLSLKFNKYYGNEQ